VSKKLVSLTILVLLLGACSKPTIDTSSDERMKASVAKVRESLPETQRAQFDKALQVLMFSRLDFATLIKDGANGTSTSLDQAKSSLSGKTAAQVIAEADTILASRKAKEREQALGEIKELEGKQASAEAAKRELTKFEISRSRFYKHHRDFLGEESVIELTVRNNTGHAISRAYFMGTLASPNRSVPWIRDGINYEIPGGLEPGEEAKWSLAPNMFSDWGKATAPDDAVLTVQVERVDGADGKPLFSTRDFTEKDAERLTKLKFEFDTKN
jgi:hypothetical protein